MISFFLLLTNPVGKADLGEGAVIGPFAYVQRPRDNVVTVGVRGDVRFQLFGVESDGPGVAEHEIELVDGRLPYGGDLFGHWKVIDELEHAALSRRPAPSPNVGRTRRVAPSSTAGKDDWGPRVAAILRSDEVDLRKLAEIGGFDAKTLFAHSDLTGVDLRGQDLTAMQIGKLDRDKVLYDEHTVWPDGTRGAP
jgi:hypothetical protein